MEWIETAANVIEAIAVTAAGVAAVWGLTTWRKEMTARRCAELAEQTLAMFYEARDLLTWVRSPGSFASEGESRQPQSNESGDDARHKNALYVPIERLSRNAEFWGRFEAARYPFMAVFGEEAAAPFQTMRKAKNHVSISAGMLLRTYGRVNEERPERQQQREKWERDIGWGFTDVDELALQIDDAVSAIESVCRPAITGSAKRSG